MKLSIICYLSDDKKLNQTTVEALEKMASYSLEHDNQVTVAENMSSSSSPSIEA